MRIDRCICFARSFDDLLGRARELGITDIVALQEIEPFGQNCGLCRPYMRRALHTGQTVFHEVLADEDVETPG